MNRLDFKTQGVNYSSYTIPVISLILVIFLFDDYGITWDESVQSHYGELALDYYKSGLTDTRCNRFLNLKLYGPLFELICAMAYHNYPELKYEIRHLCIASIAVLTIFGLIKFGQFFRDPFVPFFASLALMMLPRFIGHGFNNSKDIPFACFFAWAIYTIAKLFISSKRFYIHGIYCGIAIGLALSIRVGGVILYGYYGMSLTFIYLVYLFRSKKLTVRPKRWEWLAISILILVVSWMIMVMFWPWAHTNIVFHPIQALKGFTNFHFQRSILFEGKTLTSTELPWYYLLKYLLIATPPTLLAFALVGMTSSFYTQIKEIHSKEALICFITQIWFFFPLVYFMIKTPNVYDGMRHFLFILPALAVFVGIGAANIYQRFQSYLPSKMLFSLILIAILFPLKEIIALHPYQMTYFNNSVGGVEKAYRNYETDYWLSSYKEAAEWVNTQARSHNSKRTNVLLAANNNSRLCADYYWDKNIESHLIFETGKKGSLPEIIDYYIATTRYGLSENFPDAQVVHSIGRENAVFTVIKSHLNP